MNRQLIEDEGSRNPMTVSELENRVRSWIGGEWHVVLFEVQAKATGYAVFQTRSDDYLPATPTVYIRQFFIMQEARGKGLGRRAFAALAATCFPAGAQISLDVLATNPSGLRFWESLGFTTYCITMRQSPGALCQQPQNP